MKKISILLLIIGLFLLAIGSFNFFEKYNNYLLDEEKDTNMILEGKYTNSNDTLIVTAIKDDLLSITINNETFDFEYNGNYYKNDVLNYLIKFQNDNLIVINNGEESTYFTKAK